MKHLSLQSYLLVAVCQLVYYTTHSLPFSTNFLSAKQIISTPTTLLAMSSDKTETLSSEAPSIYSPSIGFLGCGTIASAIATGLLSQESNSNIQINKVFVTRRSESKSKALQEQFGDKVEITDDKQHIVNEADLIFVCVLPEQVDQVLDDLDFGNDKVIVSLVSTSKLATLVEKSKLPKENVFKMICLPAVMVCEGTPLLVPRCTSSTRNLSSLLSTLGGQEGTCIECENEEIMEAMMVSTCMMGPMYGLMRTNRDFLISKGVPKRDANNFVARNYWGITKDALVTSLEEGSEEDSLEKLIAEQTPGGLNEQALRNLSEAGMLDLYTNAMQAVLNRIQGKSDGSMPK
jgi:pyrroline-5-carboxylate reductase